MCSGCDMHCMVEVVNLRLYGIDPFFDELFVDDVFDDWIDVW